MVCVFIEFQKGKLGVIKGKMVKETPDRNDAHMKTLFMRRNPIPSSVPNQPSCSQSSDDKGSRRAASNVFPREKGRRDIDLSPGAGGAGIFKDLHFLTLQLMRNNCSEKQNWR